MSENTSISAPGLFYFKKLKEHEINNLLMPASHWASTKKIDQVA